MGTMNFGGLPEEYTGLSDSGVVVVPVPFDSTSTWIKGADNGPEAILEASANMELYDIETGYQVFEQGIHTTEAITGYDNPEKLTDEVEKKLLFLIQEGKFPVTIGGNHTVSIGAIRAQHQSYKDLTILQFDAHTDLRHEYLGSRYNHACVMARAIELGPVVQVGIRSMCDEEPEFLIPGNVFYAHEMTSGSKWQQKALERLSKNVYITIDLDVFDPSIMPSTGTPEPGGMMYYEVLNFLRDVIEQKNVTGLDVVELCPNQYNKAPDFLAAKLIYQILSYKFRK